MVRRCGVMAGSVEEGRVWLKCECGVVIDRPCDG
jgi:hypothetical protein